HSTMCTFSPLVRCWFSWDNVSPTIDWTTGVKTRRFDRWKQGENHVDPDTEADPPPVIPASHTGGTGGQCQPCRSRRRGGPRGDSWSCRFGRQCVRHHPEGERAVGQYPDATPEEALEYFAKKYVELVESAVLLRNRLSAGAPGREIVSAATTLQESLPQANVVGD